MPCDLLEKVIKLNNNIDLYNICFCKYLILDETKPNLQGINGVVHGPALVSANDPRGDP